MPHTMDWTELPYFLAVARTGSLRAAAEEVGGTHATVNRHLQALEAAYGVRLFDRTRSGLTLTSAGEALRPMAETAEEAVLGARARIQGLDREASGLVRVSIPPTLSSDVLPDIFADFSQAHPDIRLQIFVTNKFQSIARLETDVSVRIAYEVNDDVVGRKVVGTSMGIFAAQSYLDRNWANAGPKGEGLDWIGFEGPNPRPDWIRNSPFPKARVRHSAREFVMQKNMCRAGMGLAYMPNMWAQKYPDLIQVPGTKMEMNRSIWLLLHSDLRNTTRVRLFVDFVAQALREKRSLFMGSLA